MKEISCEHEVWFQLAQDMVVTIFFKSVMNQRVPRKTGNLFTTWPIVNFGICSIDLNLTVDNLVNPQCWTVTDISKLPIKFSCELEFLGAEGMKIMVRNMTPYSEKDIYRSFIRMWCIYVQLIRRSPCSCETFENIRYTTRRHIPKSQSPNFCSLQTSDTLKKHMLSNQTFYGT